MSRVRAFDDVTTADTYSQKAWELQSGKILWDNQIPFTSSRLYKGMTDVVTPQFKALQARGIIVNNPMCKEMFWIRDVPAIWHMTNSNYWGYNEGHSGADLGVSMSPIHHDSPSVETLLEEFLSEREVTISKSWANVDESAMLLAASLGELPETIRWVRSILARSIHLIKLFKGKGLKRYAKRAFKEHKLDLMSDLWLEYRYAIRPLVFDMKQAVEALQSHISKRTRTTARGWNESTSNTSTSTEAGNANRQWTNEDSVSYTSNYRGGVLYYIEEDINGLMALWGMDQPFETIWELTPFSFIIDWFFSVGSVISSWSVNPSLRPLASWITEEHAMIYTRKVTNLRCGNGYVYESGSEGVFTIGRIITRRTPEPNRPLLPSFKLNLDLGKLLDLATIARSLSKGMYVRSR